MNARRQPIIFFCLLAALWLAAPGAAAQTTGEIYGQVQTIAPDGQPLLLVGARVVLTSKADPNQRRETTSDEAGAYRFADVPPGAYRLTATLESYRETSKDVTVEAGILQEVTLEMTLAPVQEQVQVTGEKTGIQPEQTAPQAEIKAATLQNAPLVSEKFQDALPLVPGVVRGRDGLINIKGAPSTQTGWLVNSANVTDPVTGEQAISLPLDIVQDVEVLPNPYDAQYGKLAAAVTTVETKQAGEKWKYNLQNFIPRLRRDDKSIIPRFTVSGPLWKDRVSLVQSFQYRFVRTPVTSLPEEQRGSEIESFDSFTQLGFTFSQNHRLSAVFSLYPQKTRFANLNTFNRQPVTANYRQRGWMAGFQDHYLFGDGSFLESTFSLKDFDADIYPATPALPFLLRPARNAGSFFNTQNRISRRVEWLQIYNLRPVQAQGPHQFKFGYNVSRDDFRGFHRSTPVEVRRADDTLAERIEFTGNTLLDREKTEVSLFAQDKWNVARRLTLDFGLRYDRDTLGDRNNLAPRAAFALVLTNDNRTLLRGGIGLFYDKVPLNVGTFTQLQQRIITRFAADGITIVDGPRTFANRLGNFENPRSVAFNLELDRELTPNLLLRLGYLQREARHEFILEPFDDLGGMPVLLLAASGQSRYREAQVTLNYRFREDSFLNISYVHAQSLGDLNNFQEYFGNFEHPIIRANEFQRQRFDAPDRLLIWGEIRLWYKIRWAPVLDLHSGFPFSLLDEEQNFVGPRNRGGRLPVFSSFDSQVWRDFKIKAFGKKRTVRVGLRVFNIFHNFNPRDVQQNIDAFDALGLYNSRGRIYRTKFSIDF